MSIAFSDCFSDLLCDEDSTTIFSVSTNEVTEYSSEIESPLQQDTDEYIASLLEDEIDFDGVNCGGSSLPPVDSSLRASSIAWILKVHRYYGFQSLTAYLSVSYLDRFLRLHHLPKMNGWPMQLLSVTCLSLAAKMEESLVPSLLDLQVEGAKFIFEASNIQRMELLVLRVLNWRLGSISPFSYLSFFSLKIDQTGTYSGFIESMAKQAILSTMQETSFLEYRPSCTAAAAILHAAHELPKFFSITAQHAESWCDGLLKDNITSCYELIQSATSLNTKQPKVLPQLRVMTRPSITTSNDSSDSSSSSPTSSYKRRKLNNKSWADDDKETSD